jgi:hypothetical protein
MSIAAPPSEAKKKCSYEHQRWHCPFDAEDGHDLCIFHLPVEQKKPEDFWRHMSSYLRALYESAGNQETDRFLSEKRDELWFLRESDAHLTDGYKTPIAEAEPWRFTGFVFPAMDEDHRFRSFVFAATNFWSATFSGDADFGDATFGAKANFLLATFNAEVDFGGAKFTAEANFWNARFNALAYFRRAMFSAEANFGDTKFTAEAHFVDARFNALAYFGRATFSTEADFLGATFGALVHFGDTKFSGEGQFGNATFSAEADFGRAEFSAEANFGRAEFSGDADFSFVQFVQPPLFAEADFKSRVDFYEARLPGLSELDGERTARGIRLLAERYGSYADAGDFYMIEMDCRRERFRRTPGRWFQYVLMELYRFSSRYGESPGRAVVSFLAVLAGFGVLYSLAGFSIGSINVSRDLSIDLRQSLGTLLDFLRGMWLSLINLLPGNLRGETLGVKLPTTLGKLAAVFQVVLSYVTLTLFLLAIRRRFRR